MHQTPRWNRKKAERQTDMSEQYQATVSGVWMTHGFKSDKTWFDVAVLKECAVVLLY